MAENSIHIEYNDELQPLDTLLRGVTRAGDFYATGTAEIPMPRVEVEGLGVLSFPVPESQIQELIRQATRAPYGRGEATLVHDFIADIVTRDYNGSENDALVTAASLLGAKPAGALLAGLARRHVRCLPAECVNLLGSLTARTGSSVPAEWRESLRGLAEAIVAGLSQIGEPAPEDDCRIWQIRERALPSDARLVIRLLGTLARLEAPARLAAERQAVLHLRGLP